MTRKMTRNQGRALFLAAIMVLSMIAVPLSFAGAAAAQDVESADRTLSEDEALAGSTVDVTIDTTLDEDGTLGIVEEFDPAFADVEVIAEDPETFVAGPDDANEEFVATWDEEATEFSITYRVTIPEGADVGDEFTIDGEVQPDGDADRAEDLGESVITVTDEPPEAGTLDVTVVNEDDDDAPIEDTTVDVFDDDDNLVDTLTTDVDGEASAELAPGDYQIVAYADGFTQARDDVTIEDEETTSVEIGLEEVTIDETIASGEVGEDIVFEGQTVRLTGLNDGELVQIREVVAGSLDDIERTEFRLERFVRQDGTVVFDSDRIGTGIYTLRGAGETVGDTGFEVAPHDLSMEFADDSVLDEGDLADTELELETNRGDGFTVLALEDDEKLTQGELGSIFGADTELADGTPAGVLAADGGDQEFDVSFRDIDTDEYNFTFLVTDTVATDTASITVGEFDVDINFEEGIYEEDEGDVASVTLEVEDTDEAIVTIGGEEVNFFAVVHVRDRLETGDIQFALNTRHAHDVADPDDVFSSTDDVIEDAVFLSEGDDLSTVTLSGLTLGDEELASEVEHPRATDQGALQEGDYELAASGVIGDDFMDEDGTLVEETTGAVLVLGERSTEEVNLWRAPRGTSLSDLDDIEEAVEDGVLTAVDDGDEVALGDYVMLQSEASGIWGDYFFKGGDINALVANADDDVHHSFVQTNPAANQDPVSLIVDDGAVGVDHVPNPAANEMYVGVDTRNVDTNRRDVRASQEYEARLRIGTFFSDESGVDQANPYLDDGQVDIEGVEFSAETPTAEFDGVIDPEDEFERIEAPQEEGVVISGDTNLAPATELRLRVQGEDPDFLESQTITVDENGEWSAEFDMTVAEIDQQVEASIRRGGTVLAEETILVTDPEDPFFEVSDLDPQDVTVDRGDVIDVSATITNTGGAEDTQDVEFRVGGETLASEEVTLDRDESEEVVFEGIEADLAGGDYEHGVFTDDDSQTATLTVEEDLDPADFQVDIALSEDTIEEGETIDVSATVTNAGEEEGTQSIDLTINGDAVDSQDVTLAGGEDATVDFAGVGGDLTEGTYDVTVSSDDDEASATLTVEAEEEPPEDDDDEPPEVDDDDGIPGFGIVVALVALLAAAGLAVRRNN